MRRRDAGKIRFAAQQAAEATEVLASFSTVCRTIAYCLEQDRPAAEVAELLMRALQHREEAMSAFGALSAKPLTMSRN